MPRYRSPQGLREAVRAYFEALPVGREHAVHRRDIEAAVPGAPERAIRYAIRDLVVIDGLDISSTSGAGYYRAGEGDELLAGGDELRSRALALFVRRREVLNNGMHRLSRQLRLKAMREVVQIEKTLTDWGVELVDAE